MKIALRKWVTGLIIAWSVAWGWLIATRAIPMIDAVTVVITRGWADYAAGVRVAPSRPPRFTDGQTVPPGRQTAALFIAIPGGLVVGMAPILLIPGRRRARNAGDATS